MKTKETPSKILIPDYKLVVREIQRHDVLKGKKGLGVFLAPD